MKNTNVFKKNNGLTDAKHEAGIYLLILSIGMILSGCSQNRTANLGVKNGRLAPCPETPNCVSSFDTKQKHTLAPIEYTGNKKEAIQKLKSIINSLKRTNLVTESENYLHVEFASYIFRFIDDVEFYFPDQPVIHIRSASRTGYSDFGANRKRIERIRKLFNRR